MAAANADTLKRSHDFINRLRSTPSPYAGVFYNGEEDCPATIDAFEDSPAGDAVIKALFAEEEGA